MIIFFTIMVMIIGSVTVASIHSMYVPFLQELGDIHLSSVSYYGAVSSLERGMLVMRYRGPGYEGVGGWRGGQTVGPASDYEEPTAFGRILSLPGSDRYGMQWRIDARTLSGNTITIPASGEGNIPHDLRGGDSENYNILSYDGNIAIIMSYDGGGLSGAYNTGDTMTSLNPTKVSVDIRPANIASSFGQLPLDSDIDNDGLGDDVILNWEFRGKDSNNNLFTILPLRVEDTTRNIVLQADRAYREANMNEYTGRTSIVFGDQDQALAYNPLVPIVRGVGGANVANEHYMTPRLPGVVTQSFKTILGSDDITDKRILITPANLLQSTNSNIYPFMEYKITIEGSNISVPRDTTTIYGESRAGPYHTILTHTQPTLPINTQSQFTFVN